MYIYIYIDTYICLFVKVCVYLCTYTIYTGSHGGIYNGTAYRSIVLPFCVSFAVCHVPSSVPDTSGPKDHINIRILHNLVSGGLRTRMSDPYAYVVFWAPRYVAIRFVHPSLFQSHSRGREGFGRSAPGLGVVHWLYPRSGGLCKQSSFYEGGCQN